MTDHEFNARFYEEELGELPFAGAWAWVSAALMATAAGCLVMSLLAALS
jgi:hypothetical protein